MDKAKPKGKGKGKGSKPVPTVQAPTKWIGSKSQLPAVRKPMAPPTKAHKVKRGGMLDKMREQTARDWQDEVDWEDSSR